MLAKANILGVALYINSVVREMLGAEAEIYFPPGRNQESWRLYHSGKAHLLEKYASATLEDHSKVETLIMNIYKGKNCEEVMLDE